MDNQWSKWSDAIWTFENKSTGAVIECNDLQFLLHELMEVKGFKIPLEAGAELLLHGKATFTFTDDEGTAHEGILQRVIVSGR